MINKCYKITGVFFIEGRKWQEQRRFALRHMRDFGFGRRQEKLETEIMDEASLFLDILKNRPIYDGEKVRSLYKNHSIKKNRVRKRETMRFHYL